MLKACVVCGTASDQARCIEHRYTRDRSRNARRQRQRIIERDGYQCQHCGRLLSGGRDTHADHIVPLAKQPGPRADHELQTLCDECNQLKGDK
jgi:5-methylcytosine-specific restriction endonuclease McrA